METPFKQIHQTFNSLEEALTGQDLFKQEFIKQTIQRGELIFKQMDLSVTSTKNKYVCTITYTVTNRICH